MLSGDQDKTDFLFFCEPATNSSLFNKKLNTLVMKYPVTELYRTLTISSEITLQVVRTSFRFYLREGKGRNSPPLPPALMDATVKSF